MIKRRRLRQSAFARVMNPSCVVSLAWLGLAGAFAYDVTRYPFAILVGFYRFLAVT